MTLIHRTALLDQRLKGLGWNFISETKTKKAWARKVLMFQLPSREALAEKKCTLRKPERGSDVRMRNVIFTQDSRTRSCIELHEN